jgi:hypothetical protein
MTKQNKIENWEKEYWRIWESDNDLTHIDDDIFTFIKELLERREKGIKISLFNSLINWAKREKQDYLWVGEKGCDMSYAYNLALEELIMYLKNKLKELKK